VYDSEKDTREHIEKVRGFLHFCAITLQQRSYAHDESKLRDPEKAIFDEYTPKLAGSTYGSDEYKQFLAEMKPALDHHYAHNSHHPEHYPNGIDGMSLLDVLEMLCDWKAATMRHNDGNLADSLRINKQRFGISDQLASILENTAKELGWL
jgi:hypothetical protein